MPELEKVKCSTPDFAEETAKKILSLLPECAGEGCAVDIEKLKQCLSSKAIEGNVERYEFTWPGKRSAKAAASAATTKTLRPCAAESVGRDGTPGGFDSQNLYIEGDNLEVLKLLQTSYANQVKMIYIDPPYNTGHDFVYRDRFSLTQKELESEAGVFDEDGNRFEVNDSAEARYHSNWCSMMYPRLKLARNLLRDDGVIFISLDDNEVTNLRKLCDEIFGESNFVANIVWQSRTSISNDYEVSMNHNHTIIYAKRRGSLVFGGDPIDATDYSNPDNDPRGPWKLVPIDANHVGGDTTYPIRNPKTGVDYYPPNGRIWCYGRETLKKLLDDGRIKFGLTDDSSPKRKLFYNERIANGDKKTPSSFLSDAGTTKTGTAEIMELFEGKKIFDYPKPTTLLTRLLRYGSPSQDSLILDFFSGSATTAHATMQLNATDCGKRKFIMVQLPETCADDSEAAKAGYKTICEIGKERIRRAGKKIAKENATAAPNLDIGFRVLKLDTSSLRETSATVSETTQEFANFERIKSDRSPEDLLFQMLLETRISLSDPVETKVVGGNNVFFVSDKALVACLDPAAKMTTEFFIEIAKLKPGIAFFRDDAFADDSARTNLQQAFDQFSPTTSIKVI